MMKYLQNLWPYADLVRLRRPFGEDNHYTDRQLVLPHQGVLYFFNDLGKQRHSGFRILAESYAGAA